MSGLGSILPIFGRSEIGQNSTHCAFLEARNAKYFDDRYAPRHGVSVSMAQIDYEPGSLAGAIEWISTVMLGSVASAVAIVAIAVVGLLMLAGRICWRRAFYSMLGCFVLFSARSIALAFSGLVGTTPEQSALSAPPSAPPPSYRPSEPPPSYDPYAGASVPSPKGNDL